MPAEMPAKRRERATHAARGPTVETVVTTVLSDGPTSTREVACKARHNLSRRCSNRRTDCKCGHDAASWARRARRPLDKVDPSRSGGFVPDASPSTRCEGTWHVMAVPQAVLRQLIVAAHVLVCRM